MRTVRTEDGVPYCTTDACASYDGKRCRLMGRRPSVVCEPEVQEIAAKLADAKAGLKELRAILERKPTADETPLTVQADRDGER